MKLIVSQEKLEENRKNQMLKNKVREKNQLLKNKARENYQKQLKTKRIAFGIVVGLIVAYFVGLIIISDLKATKQARDNCLKNGYSMAYCLKNS